MICDFWCGEKPDPKPLGYMEDFSTYQKSKSDPTSAFAAGRVWRASLKLLLGLFAVSLHQLRRVIPGAVLNVI